MATQLIEPSTSRLVLRQWRERDRAPFAALNADPLVMEHFPAPLTRDESDAMVDRCVEQIQCHGYGLWAVEARTSGEFIGFVGLAVPAWEAAFTLCTRLAPGQISLGPRLCDRGRKRSTGNGFLRGWARRCGLLHHDTQPTFAASDATHRHDARPVRGLQPPSRG
jgi:Acetyltransferase (GNAT) domain